MCGIAAFFSQSKPVLTGALADAVQSLIHRGPDNQSVWASKDQRVGLGHTRLSIIDLATGDQPIANEDERVCIVVNGEFYDFERQRFELKKRGHRFRTRSDSEIALHLYEDFGAPCLRHLRGEFAFALWDESNQLLLAARDRFGTGPAMPDRTLFEGVHQVPPGRCLIVTPNGMRAHRYWEFDYTPAERLCLAAEI
jgi:asparagine synthase (glutamine-hydrolysing)